MSTAIDSRTGQTTVRPTKEPGMQRSPSTSFPREVGCRPAGNRAIFANRVIYDKIRLHAGKYGTKRNVHQDI